MSPYLYNLFRGQAHAPTMRISLPMERETRTKHASLHSFRPSAIGTFLSTHVQLFLSRNSRLGDIWRAGEFAPHLIDSRISPVPSLDRTCLNVHNNICGLLRSISLVYVTIVLLRSKDYSVTRVEQCFE